MSTILNLYDTDWVSLYVPEIPTDLELDGVSMTTKESLKDYFENKLALGEVSQVVIFQNKPQKNRQDTISCCIYFKHWYKDAYPLRYKLNTEGDCEMIGYIDSDRVYDNFKNNHPHFYFRVSVQDDKQVPEPMVVDTSKVDLTNTNEVLDMFELLTMNAESYDMRIDEQENIINTQRSIISGLLKEKKNSGKKV